MTDKTNPRALLDEPVEPPDGSVVLVNGDAWQLIDNHWYVVGEEMPHTWDVLRALGTPTVIHTPKEAP